MKKLREKFINKLAIASTVTSLFAILPATPSFATNIEKTAVQPQPGFLTPTTHPVFVDEKKGSYYGDKRNWFNRPFARISFNIHDEKKQVRQEADDKTNPLCVLEGIDMPPKDEANKYVLVVFKHGSKERYFYEMPETITWPYYYDQEHAKLATAKQKDQQIIQQQQRQKMSGIYRAEFEIKEGEGLYEFHVYRMPNDEDITKIRSENFIGKVMSPFFKNTTGITTTFANTELLDINNNKMPTEYTCDIFKTVTESGLTYYNINNISNMISKTNNGVPIFTIARSDGKDKELLKDIIFSDKKTALFCIPNEDANAEYVLTAYEDAITEEKFRATIKFKPNQINQQQQSDQQ